MEKRLRNRKGFTLVELLGTITILGILMTISIVTYSRYIDSSKQKSYDILAESASQAAEEYKMDHPSASSVNFDELVYGEYLESAADPSATDTSCTGTVNITVNKSSGSLDTQEYSVSVCCANYNYTYRFPSGNKVKNQSCAANENTLRLIEQQKNTNCVSGKTKTISYSIYTMDYVDRTCATGSNGKYGTCSDSIDNLPCRRYVYHQRKCSCTYSTVTNKFCSSSVAATGDNHTMKIRYYATPEGIAACKSNEPSSINSYVSRVCTYGTYGAGKDVMTFHGYQFFKGQSTGYTEFTPNGSWFHDGGYYDDRVARGADVDGQPDYEDGCKNTCIHFTEKWMGPVS